MRVVIAGGHGQIALLLEKELARRGDDRLRRGCAAVQRLAHVGEIGRADPAVVDGDHVVGAVLEQPRLPVVRCGEPHPRAPAQAVGVTRHSLHLS